MLNWIGSLYLVMWSLYLSIPYKECSTVNSPVINRGSPPQHHSCVVVGPHLLLLRRYEVVLNLFRDAKSCIFLIWTSAFWMLARTQNLGMLGWVV